MTRKRDHTPFISAHQGNCGVPELPLAERYGCAIDLKVDYVELDVRRTKDGIYVICHDEYTPSKRRVDELSYEEYRSELGDQALIVPELLTIAKGRVGLHVDLKETGYEDDIIRLILSYVSADEFIITTLEDVSIKVIKERFPAIKAGLSLGRDMRGASIFKQLSVRLSELFPGKRLQKSHADFVAAQYFLATINVLRYCASKGIPVWVWTVDNERSMLRFLKDPRVTTLITNKPEVALPLRAKIASTPIAPDSR